MEQRLLLHLIKPLTMRKEKLVKMLHISDWHGEFLFIPPEEKYDMVVCSGDLMPNWDRANPEKNKEGQPKWVEAHLKHFHKLIGGRPFLFCAGNHDFVDPCGILKDDGLNAINITNKKVKVNGKTFYGFPYIPYIVGEWMYELQVPEMLYKVGCMMESFPVDVLVSHSPLAGYLDRCEDDRAGNSVLANSLFYGDMPSRILCGHLHAGEGFIDLGETQISNAACSWRIVSVRRD